MKRNFIWLLVISYSCLLANAQIYPIQQKKIQAIKKIIEGYNEKNYLKMIAPCDSGFKNNVSPEHLAKQYEPLFMKKGKADAEIIHSHFSSENHYTAKLRFEKDPKNRIYWGFYFDGNADVIGYGDGYPYMCFRKTTNKISLNKKVFENKIDSLIKSKYVSNDGSSFNGVVTVLDNGHIAYNANYGFVDFDLKTPVTDSTLFDIASCTKQFTALAILLLADEGALALSDSIQKFIPDFPYHGITIQHLITHTSGLPEYMNVMDRVWDKSKFATNYDIIEVMKKEKTPVEFMPGEKFSYSNFGYATLALMVEKISGKSFADFLRTKFFIPLGMTHTFVRNIIEVKSGNLKNAAFSYIYSEELNKYLRFDTIKGKEAAIYLSQVTGDGGVYTCSKDLQKWELELLNPKVIKPAVIKEAFANHKLNNGMLANYGAGFFLVNDIELEPVVYHTGGWAGFESVLLNFFNQKKQIIILCNNGYDYFTTMADDIASVLLNEK